MPNDRFYKSREYREWVAAVFAAAAHDEQGRPLCERCLRLGRKTVATIAHHKKSRKRYPELALEVRNGSPLCATCHNIEHPEKGGSHANRYPPPLRTSF